MALFFTERIPITTAPIANAASSGRFFKARTAPRASAANHGARLLRRRLLGILHADRPRRLRGGAAVRLLAVATLLTQPALRPAAAARPTPTPDADAEVFVEPRGPDSPLPLAVVRPPEPPTWPPSR